MTDVKPISPPHVVSRSAPGPRIKTGIVMMNLGGPATLDDVEPFLLELFADREIIQLPLQRWLGPVHRSPPNPKGTRNLYASYRGRVPDPALYRGAGEGHGRPVGPDLAGDCPHKFYVAFRYTHPRAMMPCGPCRRTESSAR